jgi:GxxExxY protein
VDESGESGLSDLILKEEVYAVVGAAIDVHRELGPGFLESIYQEAMEIELSARDLPFVAQQPISVLYKGSTLKKQFFADLVCFGQIIVEIKALPHLSGTEKPQLLNYLKGTGLSVGILINFGSPGKLEWKRLVK